MNMKTYQLLFVLIFFISCSSKNIVTEKNLTSFLATYTLNFDYTENENQFILKSENGYLKNKKEYVTKKSLSSHQSTDSVEQIAVISKVGKLKDKIFVLRPLISQYKTWFDGKKYFTETKMDVEKKSMIVKMISPEEKWNGVKEIPVPEGTGVYCYFSQLIDCVKVTGFFKEAKLKKVGEINFTIIWDGYPYMMSNFINMKEELFSRASIQYDEEDVEKKGTDTRYVLNVQDHSIFLFLDDSDMLKKMFWIAQGISQVRQAGSK